MNPTWKTMSRRWLMQGSAATVAALASRTAFAQDRKITTTSAGFETAADVEKAEQEGAILFYTHDSDPAGVAITEAFTKDFPKIKASYTRAQTGALFSKILAERSAGRFLADAIQFSDIPTAYDFKKRGGYDQYMSPQAKFYAPEYLSDPIGFFFFSGVTFAGIAYNTDHVPAADAPKNWKDLLDPRWKNTISMKQATSGMQFAEWLELKKLYGDDYWKEFAKQKPRGFDSRAQIFDRLAKGDDKICGLAEWAGYLLVKQKGAHVAFVTPPDGMPATPTAAGVVNKAPHPEAARLFIDWLASPRGQQILQNNPYLYYPSLRKDAQPMGDIKLSELKLLLPTDVPEMTAAMPVFVKQWNDIMGLGGL